MSLKIIKAGIIDTVQDAGRFGYQHTGINPGGAMDRYHAQLANALLGKDLLSPVLELHYPAACLQAQQSLLLCITGAHFTPVVNDKPVAINQPVILNKGAVLQFRQWKWGAHCYLSFLPEMNIDKWLNSFSTHLKAMAGGRGGQALQKNDVLPLAGTYDFAAILKHKDHTPLPWRAPVAVPMASPVLECIIGHEWNNLTEEAKSTFQTDPFFITTQSDRMGYRLQGKDLQLKKPMQLVSSGVKFGTIQLLPSGQLIVLMADHQTTGGYPRIAHVIGADLPTLAQVPVQGAIRFRLTDLFAAEQKYMQQQKTLQQLQTASRFHMEKWFHHDFRS